MEKKHSVGLIVLVPDFAGYSRVALLHRRGTYNFEERRPESWPGSCQLTVHGRVEKSDRDIESALMREIEEEIGKAFFIYAYSQAAAPLTQLYHNETEGKIVTTFGIMIRDPNFTRHIRLHSSSGGLILLSGDKIPTVLSLKQFEKSSGVDTLDTIAMFDDDLEALKRAFTTL